MPIILICAECGNPFQARTVDAHRGQCCSRACGGRYRGRQHSGAQNPMYVPHVSTLCAVCGISIERPPSGLKAGAHVCSPACRVALTRTLTGTKRYNYKGGPYPMACEVCGTIRMVRYSLVSRFRACSRRCACEIGRRTWPRTSSLETLLLRAFASADIVVEHQFPVEYFTVDFAIPSAMLIIEADGIYWHNLPTQVKRDRAKDAVLQRLGWTIIRFSEPDIRADAAGCVARVATMLTHAAPP